MRAVAACLLAALLWFSACGGKDPQLARLESRRQTLEERRRHYQARLEVLPGLAQETRHLEAERERLRQDWRRLRKRLGLPLDRGAE